MPIGFAIFSSFAYVVISRRYIKVDFFSAWKSMWHRRAFKEGSWAELEMTRERVSYVIVFNLKHLKIN